MHRSLRLLRAVSSPVAWRTPVSLLPSTTTFRCPQFQQSRNYVVIFHAPESDKKKLTAEEEEMEMELGDDYREEDEVFSEEVDNFEDVRFDFSTISYDNYLPGGNDIRSFLQEDDEHLDAGGDQFVSKEEHQEIDAAITYHGSDENYGYRLEHEKRKDKRRRIANRRKGLKSSKKVYAMISYLEMKKEYCSASWDNADSNNDNDNDEVVVDSQESTKQSSKH